MVRIAKREELQRVNEIRKQVAVLHANGRPDIFRDDFPQEMQDLVCLAFDAENSDVLVVIRDEIIVGFAMVDYVTKPLSLYNIERKYYEIRELGVDENFRRNGAGRELFDYIKSDAKQKGIDRIELDMWEFNQNTLKFYEAIGFKTYRRYMEADIK